MFPGLRHPMPSSPKHPGRNRTSRWKGRRHR